MDNLQHDGPRFINEYKLSVLLTLPHQEILNDYITYQRSLFSEDGPASLYDPVRYILDQPGKKIRPLLCLLTAQGLAGDHKVALPVAAAIETFHNFTLMHDDIMDEAPTRRGRPTVHLKYGLAQGILSGDVMMIQAYRLLMRTELAPETRNYMVQRFSDVATAICEGQQRDMDFERRADVSVDEYIYMVEQKTAVVLGACLELGALVAGMERERASQLFHFGRLLGISFQIQDDWLDTFGDADKTGKVPGGDIARKKKTIVFMEGMRMVSEPVRNGLTALYMRPEAATPEEVQWVIRNFEAHGVDKLVEAKIYQTMDQARERLVLAELPDALNLDLLNIADALVSRDH